MFGARREISAEVDLDGDRFRVTMSAPPGPEACLWALADDWTPLLPGALPGEQRNYWAERLADPEDPLDRSMLRPLAFRLAQQVYGVPWWAAHRITEEAAGSYLAWQAWSVRHGFRPQEESADRIIAACVAWISSGWSDEKDAMSWHRRTFMAPPGVK